MSGNGTGSNDVISELNSTTIRILTPRGPRVYNIADLFAIDDSNLGTEFANQAAVYAYFASLVSFVEKQVADLDLKLDQTKARLDGEYRQQMERNSKKYTEAVISSLIVQDAEYKAAHDAYHDKLYDYNLLKALVRALEQRADMLVSLGSHLRHEADMTGMQIKDMEYNRRVEEAKKAIRSRQ